MSRVGKQILTIPAKTELTVADDRISVKGPLGELSRVLDGRVSVDISGKEVKVNPKAPGKEGNVLSGTYVAHIKNMIEGVNKAFVKKLIIEGIGYKADAQGDTITFGLGFSHPVKVKIPVGIKVTTEKGVITITGSNVEQVGQFTADIRDLKRPEPYKGKGIRYEKEVVRRKEGKKNVA